MSIGSYNNFSFIGMITLGYHDPNMPDAFIEQIFISHYGSCVRTCYEVWYQLVNSGKLLSDQNEKHLFWTLLYLKVYCTQRVICTFIKTSRTTFNKHVHHVVKVIAGFTNVSNGIISTVLNAVFIFLYFLSYITRFN